MLYSARIETHMSSVSCLKFRALFGVHRKRTKGHTQKVRILSKIGLQSRTLFELDSDDLWIFFPIQNSLSSWEEWISVSQWILHGDICYCNSTVTSVVRLLAWQLRIMKLALLTWRYKFWSSNGWAHTNVSHFVWERSFDIFILRRSEEFCNLRNKLREVLSGNWKCM